MNASLTAIVAAFGVWVLCICVASCTKLEKPTAEFLFSAVLSSFMAAAVVMCASGEWR